MAKDDLKLKDLFTRLVNWIKGKFSEQDTKIAANKYTLPQATETSLGGVKIRDNQDSVLYSQYKGTAAGVSHVDNVIKSFEVGMNAQLNLKQDKIKIVTTEPTASSTASDPEGTIYFKV